MDIRAYALTGLVALGLLLSTALTDATLARPCAQPQATPTDEEGTPEALPDLVVSDTFSDRTWDGPRNCWPGNELYSVIDVQVQNRGDAPANHFLVRGEESARTPVTWEVQVLAGGEERWLGLQRGAARVVVVDVDDEVRESDESNNRITRAPTYMMTPPPRCTPTPTPTPGPRIHLPHVERPTG
jgi:hypothetical protein